MFFTAPICDAQCMETRIRSCTPVVEVTLHCRRKLRIRWDLSMGPANGIDVVSSSPTPEDLPCLKSCKKIPEASRRKRRREPR